MFRTVAKYALSMVGCLLMTPHAYAMDSKKLVANLNIHQVHNQSDTAVIVEKLTHVQGNFFSDSNEGDSTTNIRGYDRYTKGFKHPVNAGFNDSAFQTILMQSGYYPPACGKWSLLRIRTKAGVFISLAITSGCYYWSETDLIMCKRNVTKPKIRGVFYPQRDQDDMNLNIIVTEAGAIMFEIVPDEDDDFADVIVKN
jgi:hypothetical protein